MQNKWSDIISDLSSNPRDLPAVPRISKLPLWFYAFSDGKNIYITNAKEHSPSSKLSMIRTLKFSTFVKIYPIHLRREKGERVSREAKSITANQTYWYSVITHCLRD